MIVKDESDVIQRCLLSVKGIVDYWVIVDTGSSDGTQKLIRETLAHIPGELYERPWVHFEHNRNEALELARNKASYILFIDADETLEISGEFNSSSLDLDGYKVRLIERNLTDVYRMSLVKDDRCWFWKGVLHEALYASRLVSVGVMETLVKHSFTEDGKRTKDPKKFEKDAAILEKALAQEPNNSRYTFYLAQSYGNARQYIKSLQWYRRRSEMGADPEEVFWSFYCMGMIHQHIQSDPTAWIESYTKAHQADPSRAEPLFQLARYFYDDGQPLMSYSLGKMACELKKPDCAMYFHAWVYDYAALFVLAQSAEELGLKQVALNFYQTLKPRAVPEDMRLFIHTAIERLS
jgi:glycosyltransferase involved in cell wall biosynthesis